MSKARDLANIISGSGTLNANVIPDLAASKITSGTLGADRIPDLATSKITSGTFADARISASSVNAHVDLTSLSASNLTSGTVPSARLSLAESDVPSLSASKVTSGSFDTARIPNLSAAKITSGTMDGSRISGGTFGSVNGSALTSLPSSAPTNSQILSGVASVSAGSVGSYVCFSTGGFAKGYNTTFSTNNSMFYCNMKGLYVGSNTAAGFGQIQPSGTYRAMGMTNANDNLGGSATVFLRIS